MSRKTRKLIWSAPLVAVLAVAGASGYFCGSGAQRRASLTTRNCLGRSPILSATADGYDTMRWTLTWGPLLPTGGTGDWVPD